MTILVVGTALVYLMDLFSGGMFSAMLDFYPAAILRGQVWRLVTFLFIPLSYRPITLLLSLYFYWWIGKSLEREWGTTKFTVFYACGVLFNIIFGFLAGSTSVTYLNLSLFFAFASLYPDLQVLLIFIPVKVKWLAWIDAAFFALTILFNLINFNFVGALLPLAAGALLLFFPAQAALILIRLCGLLMCILGLWHAVSSLLSGSGLL